MRIILDVPYNTAELRVFNFLLQQRANPPLVCQACGLPTSLCPFNGEHPEGM
jgi:hypothetical protein